MLFRSYGYKPIENEVSSVFLPSMLMAIRKDTSNEESAIMFLQTMLGRETQTNLLSGLSVIESIFSDILQAEEDTAEPISYMGMSDQEGKTFEYTIYVTSDELKEDFYHQAQKVAFPYIENTTVEAAILQQVTGYYNDQQSLEETLDKIEAKIAIYLAE